MDPSANEGLPVDMLAEGVAVVRDDGSIEARNAPMRALLLALGGDAGPVQRLADLPLDGDALARLAAGERVDLVFGRMRHELRNARHGGRTWLLAVDRTVEHDLTVARLAEARVRRLGGMAADLVHELANHLAVGLGLAEVLQPYVTSDADQRMLTQMSSGTRQGIMLARSLARLLDRRPERRSIVRLTSIVDETMGVLAKFCRRREVDLSAENDAARAEIRVESEIAAQALLNVALFAVGHGARAVALHAQCVVREVMGGRARRVACVRIATRGVPSEVRALTEGALRSEVPPLQAVSRLGTDGADILQARMAAAHCGGELTVDTAAPDLTFELMFPLVACTE